jgi:sodium-coupled neutral amino acid transporter 9
MTTVNTMLGSSMLILPIIFADIGLLTGIIVLTIICITNFITANILLRHGKSSEDDLPEMIYRILGIHFFRL